MAQKNFSIGLDFKEDFEQFCAANAYTESAVMAAAFLAFSGLTHEERVKWFGKSAQKWTGSPKARAIEPRTGSARGKAAG